jgi:hypothetical protein
MAEVGGRGLDGSSASNLNSAVTLIPMAPSSIAVDRWNGGKDLAGFSSPASLE